MNVFIQSLRIGQDVILDPNHWGQSITRKNPL